MSEKDLVPLETSYATALGRAMYIFSRLEWQAVWCCEKITPGSIGKPSKRTAGRVSKKLTAAVKSAPKEVRNEFETASNRFSELLEDRNALAHGKPCTAPDGGQRISRYGKILTHEFINNAADEFAKCESNLNKIFYSHLSSL